MQRPRRDVVRGLAVVIAMGVSAAGCTATGAGTSSSASSPVGRSDPKTRQALLQIAVRFNDDYAANRDGLVYDRWDARSRMVIGRAAYVRRHRECPTAPGPAVVESASVSTHGYWRVDYSISGIQLEDYWHYVGGRWLFDLPRSNPDAVRLYRLPFAKYAKAVGCALPG